MATYRTQIQFGDPDASWQDDTELTIHIQNRNAVIPDETLPPTGTQVSWAGPEGNVSITFFNDGNSFQGAAQFPGEGPVGYRGEAK